MIVLSLGQSKPRLPVHRAELHVLADCCGRLSSFSYRLAHRWTSSAISASGNDARCTCRQSGIQPSDAGSSSATKQMGLRSRPEGRRQVGCLNHSMLIY